MLDHILVVSLVAHVMKNLSATQETWVQSLGWEDPLEKGTVTKNKDRRIQSGQIMEGSKSFE